jgi:hypothetical protein
VNTVMNLPGSISWEIHECLSDWWLLKKDSACLFILGWVSFVQLLFRLHWNIVL